MPTKKQKLKPEPDVFAEITRLRHEHDNPKSTGKINPDLQAMLHAAKRLRNAITDPAKSAAIIKAALAKHGPAKLADVKADKRPAVVDELRVALALHLATIGPIHPLRPLTKRPFLNAWQKEMTQDAATIRDLCRRFPDCNWGISLNVVDIDSAIKPGNTCSGLGTLGDLIFENGADSYSVKTPSGGEHIYIADDLPNGANTLGEGVDSRAAGKGYVVAAGSYVVKSEQERVAVTGYYSVTNDKPIASVKWLADRAGNYTPAPERGDEVPNPDPIITCEALAESLAGLDPQNFRDQNAWLKLMFSCHYATAGQGFTEFYEWSLSDAGYKGKTDDIETRWNSCKVHAKGDLKLDSPGGLIDCLRNAGRDDLAGSLAGADAGFQNETGQHDSKASNDNTAEEIFGKAEKPDYSDGYDSDAFEDAEFPNEVELIENLLLEGSPQTIDADGGVGKSLVCAQMGVHVAAGAPMFGRKAIQRPVLFVTHEDRYSEVRKRMRATAKSIGRETGLRGLPIRVVCEVDGDLTIANIKDHGQWTKGPYYQKLDELIGKAGPGALVILDCQADFAQGDFLTSRPVPNTWYKVVLAGLCRKHQGATILVICHPSKAAMADGSFSEGSTANRTAVRRKIVMKLVNSKNPDGPRWLGLLKNNYGPQGKMVKLVWRAGIFVLDSDPDLTVETITLYTRIVDKVCEMIGRRLVVVKHKQADGHNPEDVARGMNEDRDGDADGLMPTPEDVRAALAWAERKGMLRYVGFDKNKHVKAHYEVGPGNTSPDGIFRDPD